jgi:hypothetical protein
VLAGVGLLYSVYVIVAAFNAEPTNMLGNPFAALAILFGLAIALFGVPLITLGAWGLLRQRAWGWCLLLVCSSGQALLWAWVCFCAWCAHDAGAGAWTLLALLFFLAMVAVLLRDSPQFWERNTA